MLSENIKVSEVSDILRKQLEGIDTRVQLDEIGTSKRIMWVLCCLALRIKSRKASL